MTDPTTVYDLGEIDQKAAKAKAAAASLNEAVREASGASYSRSRPQALVRAAASWVQTCAAMVVPGAGQLLRGDLGAGLFYLSWTGCFLAFAGAAWGGRERFIPTVELLGWPREIGFWAILASLAGAAALHVASLVSMAKLNRREAQGRPAPAVVAGTLSALVPGWGQAVHGQPIRCAMFLGGLWLMLGVTLVRTQGFQAALQDFGLVLPSALNSPGLPWLGGGVLAALWILSVYDALASVFYSSRRS